MPRHLENDRWLFGVTLALCLLGAVMIFSASAVTAEHQYGRPYIFLVRQAAWLVLGVFGMFALMRTDYRRLREPGVVCTAVCVVLLMLIGTFFLDKSHATHRWIKFGPVGIQPSELAKLAIILYLAWFLDLKRRNAAAMEFSKDDFLQTILPAVGPILLFVLLIVAQPDLGTSVDIVLIATAILFVAGLSWKWLVVGTAARPGGSVVEHGDLLFLQLFDQPHGAGRRLKVIARANTGHRLEAAVCHLWVGAAR